MAAQPNHLVIQQGREFSSTAYRRADDAVTVIPIPAGYEARMKFAARYDGSGSISLSSSPVDGLVINYALGEIAIYIGAVETALLNANVKLVWDLEIYDPLVANTVIFLGSGTAVVEPKVP